MFKPRPQRVGKSDFGAYLMEMEVWLWTIASTGFYKCGAFFLLKENITQ